MVTLRGDWSRFDALVRELGALRSVATLRSDVADSVKAEINELIDEAARAVDGMLDSPDDDHKALAAWELILMAEDLVESLRLGATDTGQLMTTEATAHLRSRAADAMRRAAQLDIELVAPPRSADHDAD